MKEEESIDRKLDDNDECLWPVHRDGAIAWIVSTINSDAFGWKLDIKRTNSTQLGKYHF